MPGKTWQIKILNIISIPLLSRRELVDIFSRPTESAINRNMKTTSEVSEQTGIDRWQIARYCLKYGIGRRIGTQWLLGETDIKMLLKLRSSLEKRTKKHKNGRRTD